MILAKSRPGKGDNLMKDNMEKAKIFDSFFPLVFTSKSSLVILLFHSN